MFSTEPRPREPAFDPWRYASSSALKDVVAEVIRIAINVEAHLQLRDRKRRPEAMAVFTAAVEAIVCNALYWSRLGYPCFHVTRSKRVLSRSSRYTSPLLTEQLPYIMDLLCRPETDFLVQNLGGLKPFAKFDPQTTLTPHERLLRRLQPFTCDDTSRREGEELVLLKGLKGKQRQSEYMEYDDTALTHQYRTEVKRINAALRETNIEYLGNADGIDERNTYIRRYFNNGGFGNGGRLFGGFWQQLSKQDRLANIIIEGERVVGLDFRSMVAQLAYAFVDAELTSDDPYAIPGLPRATVKQLFGALMAVDKPLGNWPKDIPSGGLKLREVIAKISEAHPAIAPMFFQGRGLSLMFTESEILIDALLQLLDKGIVALPVHDCIVVAESNVDAARQALKAAFAHNCRGRIPRIAEERATSTIEETTTC